MARTTIALVTAKGPYPTLPVTANSLDAAMTAADTVNLNQTPFGASNEILLIARNTDASAQTITITSKADTFNRTGDISAYSIGAGEMAVIKIARNGWIQSDGYLYYQASDDGVLFTPVGI